MELPRVDSEDLSIYFDTDTGLAWAVYRGVMTASLIIKTYKTIAQLASQIADQQNAFLGGIFDFRAVTDFDKYSLSTVMRESKRLNMKMDFSQLPVALLVGSALQEHMVRVTMKVTPQDYRKRIVHSEEEALEFFKEWHARHAKTD